MKEAGGKHSKEEYDNRIIEANATNAGAKKREKTAEKGQILRKNDYHLQNERKSLGRAFCTA